MPEAEIEEVTCVITSILSTCSSLSTRSRYSIFPKLPLQNSPSVDGSGSGSQLGDALEPHRVASLEMGAPSSGGVIPSGAAGANAAGAGGGPQGSSGPNSGSALGPAGMALAAGLLGSTHDDRNSSGRTSRLMVRRIDSGLS